MSSDKRGTRGKQGKKQANPGGRAARGEGVAGGERPNICAPHRAQRDAVPMTSIEPYWPPRPTIRELMEDKRAGVDDGGIPPRRYLGRLPKSAYRTEERVEARGV